MGYSLIFTGRTTKTYVFKNTTVKLSYPVFVMQLRKNAEVQLLILSHKVQDWPPTTRLCFTLPSGAVQTLPVRLFRLIFNQASQSSANSQRSKSSKEVKI